MNNLISILKRILFFALFIAFWTLLYEMHIWKDYLFPSPFSVFKTIFYGIKDKIYIFAALASIKRVVIGFLIAMIIGIPMGILIGKFKILDETLGAMLIGFQSLPSIAWLPLAMLWFGINDKAVIFVVVFGAVFSVALATIHGVKNVYPLYIQVARTMGAKEWTLFFDVIIPAAVPSIISGMKLSWSFAWRALLAGELLSTGAGLGQVLMMGRELSDMSQVMSVMIIVALIGYIVDHFVFQTFERSIRIKWGLEK
ncbi:MAG: ABC transporter permease [Candidatus Firestonebacteria bacterium]|nr:ABC transporter permease [Candidatus Firestonebacteria bacterium]